jgi:hypothetical protein
MLQGADIGVWEVLDTAVKVGLGAVLASIGAYQMAKRSHVHEIEREAMRRRRDLLEAVAEQVEAFSQSTITYWNLTSEWVRRAARNIEMPPDRKQSWEDARTRLNTLAASFTSAEAKLLLLGEADAQLALRAWAEDVIDRYRQATMPNPRLTVDQLEEDRRVFSDRRADFFKALSSAYRAYAPVPSLGRRGSVTK